MLTKEKENSQILKTKRKPRNLEQCPYPGCLHTGTIVTKVHCRTHGMEREKLFAKFGEPEPVYLDPYKLRENLGNKSSYTNYHKDGVK